MKKKKKTEKRKVSEVNTGNFSPLSLISIKIWVVYFDWQKCIEIKREKIGGN